MALWLQSVKFHHSVTLFPVSNSKLHNNHPKARQSTQYSFLNHFSSAIRILKVHIVHLPASKIQPRIFISNKLPLKNDNKSKKKVESCSFKKEVIFEWKTKIIKKKLHQYTLGWWTMLVVCVNVSYNAHVRIIKYEKFCSKWFQKRETKNVKGDERN
jgi:hypothetical protein